MSGPGWAGAETARYRVWNENWQATIDAGGVHHLQAQTAGFAIDLHLDENRPAVLHGDHGYSRKGAATGNASHYYSLTRMPTRGTIVLDGRAIGVAGLSWMDHEFGTSFLEPEQIGWDWFSIQLDDGRDLMIFQLRRADGSIDPGRAERSSAGWINSADHARQRISPHAGQNLEVLRERHALSGRMDGSAAAPASVSRSPQPWTTRSCTPNIRPG